MSKPKKWKAAAASRDAGGFVALPWTVLDAPAYQDLSHPAKALLMEFARQYVRDNNGRLLASGAYLAKRGWTSNAVITRAKKELMDSGFIFETVKGQRPNKASWYAVTWATLDHIEGYDPGARECFQRSAYRNKTALLPTTKATKMQNTVTNGYVLTPSGGVAGLSIAPSGGVESAPPTPSGGAMRGVFGCSSTPSGGDHLEKPSVPPKRGGTAATSAQPKTATAQIGNAAANWDGIGICKRLTTKPKHLFTGLLLCQ